MTSERECLDALREAAERLGESPSNFRKNESLRAAKSTDSGRAIEFETLKYGNGVQMGEASAKR